MTELCEVIITAPDPEWLGDLSRALVERGLCASAHNFAPIRSVYRWRGDIYEREEGRVSLHTRRDRVADIVALVKRDHPYEVPGISTRPIEDGNPDYLAWIARQTEPRNADPRWQALFPEQILLAEHVDQWTLAEAVPSGVADVLRVARMLLIDSYYQYEYSLVAAAWGFLVMETTLRACLPLPNGGDDDRRSFGVLVGQARKRGLITKQEDTVLTNVVNLRNRTFHKAYLLPKPTPESYPPEAALQMLEAIHDCVSDLYSRVASRGQWESDAEGQGTPS
jgi:periplasmic divalent cation tolerance protein